MMRIAFVDSSSIRNPFYYPWRSPAGTNAGPGAAETKANQHAATDSGKLYQAQTLSQQESHQLFSAVVRGELKPEQLAAALVSMKIRGEHPNEIAGAATALLETPPFPRPDYLFADIVGTGGDGSNSINISTASAFVAAACGLKVAKHGNRSVPVNPARRICWRRSVLILI